MLVVYYHTLIIIYNNDNITEAGSDKDGQYLFSSSLVSAPLKKGRSPTDAN